MTIPRIVVTCLVAVLAATSYAQDSDIARAIAAGNAGLAAQIADDTQALDRESTELAELRKAKHDLDERMHRIEARAMVYALGELRSGASVRRDRASLCATPRAQSIHGRV